MDEGPNTLEAALAKAAADPAERPAFYRLLLESEVFVLGRMEGDAGERRRIAAAGEKISLVNWEKEDGTRVIPFFTSLEALQRALREQQSFVALPARALFEMTKGATLVLNPASSHGKKFLPNEIEALLATGMNQAPQTRIVPKATRVLLGQPADYPAQMVSSLTALLAKHPSIRAAYVCLMHDSASQEEPGLVVGLEGDGSIDEAMKEAGAVASDTAPPGITVNLVRVLPNDTGISAYFKESVKPFYERSWGTRLKAFLGHGRA